MNFKSYLTLYTKINSVWLIGPNICAPITNRKKTGEKSYDLELKISWITKRITDLSVGAKTIKILGGNVCDLGWDKIS